MVYEAFPVYDFRSGIDLSVEAWKIPSDAYVDIDNGYLRRGVLKKRLGQDIFGQLGKLHTYTLHAAASPAHQTGTITNKPVIPGSITITAGAQTITDDRTGHFIGHINPASTQTIDYTTGVYDFTFLANPGAVITTITYHYEVNEDVRGIFYFNRYSGSDLLVGVQKRRVSVWNASNEYFVNIPNAGGTYDHFNSTGLVSAHAFNDVLWLSTNEASDHIWTYNGTIMIDQTAAGNLKLNTAGTENVFTAKHIFSWHERIYLLNTVDGAGAGTRHGNRVIWSWAGDNPLNGKGFQWDIPGLGNYNDAWTNENIIDFAFLGNQPIIGFENSIWTLDYTQDPNLPAVWRKLPSVLQVSSSHGSFVLDNLAVFVGGKGLVACNGNSTIIFNDKMPDFSYEIYQPSIDLCYSIRDDHLDQALVAYSDISTPILGLTPNNRILVYNYMEGSFSKYSLNSKCFGYWFVDHDYIFDDFPDTTYSELSSMTWGDSSAHTGFPIILAGWQKGYIYSINDEKLNYDVSTWSQKLRTGGDEPVTYSFNWSTGRLNPFVNKGFRAVLGRFDILVSANNQAEFTVEFYSDMSNSPYMTHTIDCTDNLTNEKVWKSVPVNNEANFHKMTYSLSMEQSSDETIASQAIEIHAIILWMEQGSEIV